MKQLTDEQAFAQVVKVLKESFDGGTEFELFKEGPGVYRVKSRAERDGALTAGIKKLKTELHSDVDPEALRSRCLTRTPPGAIASWLPRPAM